MNVSPIGNIHKKKKIDLFLFKNILFIYYSMNNIVPETNILTEKDVLKQMNENKKVSIPILSKFEKARILGMRIQQLTDGALPLIDTKGLTNYIEIAEEELRQKKTPYIIKRRLANNKYEFWSIDELIQTD